MDAFDARLQLIPLEDRGPLVDVIDTCGAVRCALKDWGLSDSTELLLGLTELVMTERRQAQNANSHSQNLRVTD